MEYMSAPQAAKKMGHFRKAGTDTLQREPYTGVSKLGYMWLIPKDAEKPADARKKSKENEHT